MAETNEVKEIECKSWEDFTVKVRKGEGRFLGAPYRGIIYRGQTDPSWKLSSLFDRWRDEYRKENMDFVEKLRKAFPAENFQDTNPFKAWAPGSIETLRQNYLKRFKESAIGCKGWEIDKFNDDELWLLGRHHGLITPLLDWTYSPYIAAFFAFSGSMETWGKGNPFAIMPTSIFEKEKIAIWGLAVYEEKISKEGEFEYIFDRRDAFYQQKAQKAIFTKLTHDDFWDIAAYLKDKGLASYLEKYIVPGCEVGKALADLRLMNISYDSLFPDLYGASLQANYDTIISKFSETGILKISEGQATEEK